MFVLARTVTYAALFIGLVLIYVPARLLSWSGIVRHSAIEVQQVAGMVIGGAGAAVARWCIVTFASIGRGTPAPFDPPRRLVIQGSLPFRAESHVHWGRTRPRQTSMVSVAPMLSVRNGALWLATWSWSTIRASLRDRASAGVVDHSFIGHVFRIHPSELLSLTL
jgi:hypothetical protein